MISIDDLQKTQYITIDKAIFIPHMYIENPYAYCSFQAYTELHKLKEAYDTLKKRFEEVELEHLAQQSRMDE